MLNLKLYKIGGVAVLRKLFSKNRKFNYSRNKEQSHITLVIESPKKAIRETSEKEFKKTIRKLNRLFDKKMSYEILVIPGDENIR